MLTHLLLLHWSVVHSFLSSQSDASVQLQVFLPPRHLPDWQTSPVVHT